MLLGISMYYTTNNILKYPLNTKQYVVMHQNATFTWNCLTAFENRICFILFPLFSVYQVPSGILIREDIV